VKHKVINCSSLHPGALRWGSMPSRRLILQRYLSNYRCARQPTTRGKLFSPAEHSIRRLGLTCATTSRS
jgi:hypothetical protein